MSEDRMKATWWQNQRADHKDDRTLGDALRDMYKRQADRDQYPQDRSAASSVLGDTCPRCGGQLEETDGLERDYPWCPACR